MSGDFMNKLLSSKFYSILIITIIYVVASGIGFYVFYHLPYSSYINLFIADVVATIFVYLYSVVFHNSSVYDPYWSVQPMVIVLGSLFGVKLSISAILVTIVILLWGIRLTLNWAYTFPNLMKQDWRYTKYKNETGIWYQPINFLGIHLMPTLLVYLAVLPAIETIHSQSFTFISLIGFLLSLCAIMIQGLSDYQMHQYRKKNLHGLFRDGLWKYSRHPNYLGEILMWWGVAIQAFCLTGKFWVFIGAICIHLLFLTVSIPLADKRQSKKDGYDIYRKETRSLLPFPKFFKKYD